MEYVDKALALVGLDASSRKKRKLEADIEDSEHQVRRLRQHRLDNEARKTEEAARALVRLRDSGGFSTIRRENRRRANYPRRSRTLQEYKETVNPTVWRRAVDLVHDYNLQGIEDARVPGISDYNPAAYDAEIRRMGLGIPPIVDFVQLAPAQIGIRLGRQQAVRHRTRQRNSGTDTDLSDAEREAKSAGERRVAEYQEKRAQQAALAHQINALAHDLNAIQRNETTRAYLIDAGAQPLRPVRPLQLDEYHMPPAPAQAPAVMVFNAGGGAVPLQQQQHGGLPLLAPPPRNFRTHSSL